MSKISLSGHYSSELMPNKNENPGTVNNATAKCWVMSNFICFGSKFSILCSLSVKFAAIVFLVAYNKTFSLRGESSCARWKISKNRVIFLNDYDNGVLADIFFLLVQGIKSFSFSLSLYQWIVANRSRRGDGLKWPNSIYRLKNVTDTTVDRCIKHFLNDSIFNGLSSTQADYIILFKKWPFHILNWIKKWYFKNQNIVEYDHDMLTTFTLQTKYKIQNKRWCEHYARPVFITDRRTQLTLRHEVSPDDNISLLLVTIISSNCLMWYSSRAPLT